MHSRRGRGASNDGVVHRNVATRFCEADDEFRSDDVFKEGVTLVLPITEGWKKPDYKKRMVNSSKLFEPNVGTWSACGPQLLGVRRCTSSRHRQ